MKNINGCEVKPTCIPSVFSTEEKVANALGVSSSARPGFVGVPSSARPGIPICSETALDKLNVDLTQQMEKQYNKLSSELAGLREEMLGTLREDLLSAIAAIGSASAVSPTWQKQFQDKWQVSPTDPEMVEAHVNSGVLKKSFSKANASEYRAALALPEVEANGGAQTVGDDGPVVDDPNPVVDKNKPPVAFASRPNLLAFLQAKNWDSSTIGRFQNDLQGEYNKDEYEMYDRDPFGEKKTCMGKLRHIVNSHEFDMVVGKGILLNAIVMALNLEFEGEKTREQMGLSANLGGWPEADSAFLYMEHIFTLFFLVEVILRLLAMGYKYFLSGWNLLDFVIVSFSCLDMYGSALLGINLPNMTFMRLLRVAKLAKVLRIIKVFRFFYQLRVLMSAIVISIPVLGWSMCLLCIVQSIAAIFMTQSLQEFLRDESKNWEDRSQVYVHFGSFARSFMTMFEITIAPGTWGKCGRTVIHQVGSHYTFFFLGYVSFVSFAIIRVIAAIFLKETLGAAAKDSDTVMAEMNRDPTYINKIRKIFNAMDVDNNGVIALDELNGMLNDQGVQEYLKILGLNTHEVKGLFVLMDDGDAEISFDEFVAGVMRLKAAVKGVDLATLLYENKKILKRLLAVGRSVQDVGESLRQEIKKKVH